MHLYCAERLFANLKQKRQLESQHFADLLPVQDPFYAVTYSLKWVKMVEDLLDLQEFKICIQKNLIIIELYSIGCSQVYNSIILLFPRVLTNGLSWFMVLTGYSHLSKNPISIKSVRFNPGLRIRSFFGRTRIRFFLIF